MKHICCIILLAALGCGYDHERLGHNHNHGGHDHDHHGHNHNHGGDGHGHKAPHGGVLVNVENEFCHLEFVIEPGTTRLQLHAMRFHPREAPLKFFMEQIEATATVNGEEKQFAFKPTQLDGTTATTEPTSLYVAELDWLKDTATFEGTLTELKIEGKILTKITFNFAKKD